MSILIVPLAYGQADYKELKLQLYTKTIDSFFSEIVSSINKSGNTTVKPEFLLLKDSLPYDLPLSYKGFSLQLIKNQNEGIKTLEKSHKKHGFVYMITQNFRKDTLDITVSGWNISIKKGIWIKHGQFVTKQIILMAGCGGTGEYVPNGRLVYTTNTWLFKTHDQLLAERRIAIYE